MDHAEQIVPRSTELMKDLVPQSREAELLKENDPDSPSAVQSEQSGIVWPDECVSTEGKCMEIHTSLTWVRK